MGWGNHYGFIRGCVKNQRYIGAKRGLLKTIFSNPQYRKLMVLSPADLHFIFPKQLVLVLYFHSDFKTFSTAPSSSHHVNPSPNGSSKMVMSPMSQNFGRYPKPIPSLNAYLNPLVPPLHSFLPLFSYSS